MAKAGFIPLAAAMLLAGCNSVSGATDPAAQQLADRIAIEDMVVGYYAHLGGADAGAFDAYFTNDAVFDVNGTIANGRDEIEALYRGMNDREAGTPEPTSAPAPAGVFRMLLSNPVIKVDGDNATASFIWTGIRNDDIAKPPVLTEQGREYDRLVKVDGKWLFAHRVVIADSGLPEGQYENWDRRADFHFPD